MAKFKTGDVWDSRDASQVWDDVQMLAGYHENVSVPLKIEFGVTVAAIARGSVGDVTRWDTSVSPPAETTDVVECTFDWLSDEEIEADREVAYVKVGGINRILWAECNEPDPPTVVQMKSSDEPQTMSATWTDLEGMTLSYESDPKGAIDITAPPLPPLP